jgi:hypothetical protein
MVGAKSILTGKGEVKKISTEISTGFPPPRKGYFSKKGAEKRRPGRPPSLAAAVRFRLIFFGQKG